MPRRPFRARLRAPKAHQPGPGNWPFAMTLVRTGCQQLIGSRTAKIACPTFGMVGDELQHSVTIGIFPLGARRDRRKHVPMLYDLAVLHQEKIIVRGGPWISSSFDQRQHEIAVGYITARVQNNNFIPGRPSAIVGSCCTNGSAKKRSTADGSFLRKISIIAWWGVAATVTRWVRCGLAIGPARSPTKLKASTESREYPPSLERGPIAIRWHTLLIRHSF